MNNKKQVTPRLFALAAIFLVGLDVHAQAPPIPPEGQAVLTDAGVGTNNDGLLFIVDLGSGQRTAVSDFGDPAQGILSPNPMGVALQDLNTAIVATDGESDPGMLLSVDLLSGNRTVLSDFGDPAQGPLGEDPMGVVLTGDGNALVVDDNANGGPGGLFLVDLTPGPTLGRRMLISDFGDPGQGPLGQTPNGIALEGGGTALVADLDGGPGNGALFRVDLDSGMRTLISNFTNPAQGPEGSNPFDVALDRSGQALVTDQDGGDFNGVLFQVDLTPGASFGDRTVVSDFKDPAQGPLGGETEGIVLARNGDALVTDTQGGIGSTAGGLFLVNLTDQSMRGDRTLISDFGDPSQGPLGADPSFIVLRVPPVVPTIPALSPWGLVATAGVLGLVGFCAVRRKKLIA